MKQTITSVNAVLMLTLIAGITQAVAAPDPVAGKNKTTMCASCHGANGISSSPDIPDLAGQKAGYLAKQLKDFRSGTRKNPIMASVTAGLSDVDIADIAAYYAQLKP